MPSMHVTSGAELRYVAAKLRKAAARDLTRELRQAYRKSVRPLQREIKEEAIAVLPKRGAYNITMSKAVKTSVLGGLGRRALTVRVYARGKGEERDVRAVNAGIVRHPLFGHRKHWYVTRVRRGFVDRAFDRVQDRILHDAADAAEKVLQEIARS